MPVRVFAYFRRDTMPIRVPAQIRERERDKWAKGVSREGTDRAAPFTKYIGKININFHPLYFWVRLIYDIFFFFFGVRLFLGAYFSRPLISQYLNRILSTIFNIAL